ncbi:MAG: polyphosphate:AMP phosphotransferase [Acidobacteria bacterium]|nr:polyphosphate:AMP phosphotransferase [Acidobacteriota bacterium]
MFETAEVGNSISKEIYKKEVSVVRKDLLDIQKQLALSKCSAIIIIGGVEGAGKTETANQLLEWLDARGIETHALDKPTDEEIERPYMWRFWRQIPPKGRMAIYLGSWYTQPIVNRTFKKISESAFQEHLEETTAFENMLSKEGVILIKLWLHIKKDLLIKRMKKLEKDPLQNWRISKKEWNFIKKYDKFKGVSEIALGKTNTKEAPWFVVEAEDFRYRNITVSKTIISRLKEGIESKKKEPAPPLKPRIFEPPKPNIFTTLDYTKKIEEKEYEEKLAFYQKELYKSVQRMQKMDKSLILLFEGADAAGKGGTIRRITQALNAKDYRVISVAAPTDEEKARPYLWRFWRHLPRKDKITIYDRSWYGRVLVEKIEGFCTDDEWKRAYAEINQFEKELSDFGILILKFYLSITPQEQLKRFKERETTPYKQYKITEEDWRNRAKFHSYEACAIEMFEKTSMPFAPWFVIPANDKNFARIEVLKTITKEMKNALK